MLGESEEPFFIADIAANHDGSLDRALHLIKLAAESGANAVKFQHFRAETIVSKLGFDSLGEKLAHQKDWDKSVFQVYRDASLPWEWTTELARESEKNGVMFFTAPYDLEAIDYVDSFIPAFKIGSGDITWKESIEKIISKKKPIFLATGASTLREIRLAVELIVSNKIPLCLMQCNTNYSGRYDNSHFLNLNVLKKFREEFPGIIYGLSDHTTSNLNVSLGIALGASAIERHFTDDRTRPGPDHAFSLDAQMWKEMVEEAKQVKMILGNGEKKVELNERESLIVQRRALRYAREIKAGERLTHSDLVALRPCPEGAISPWDIRELLGKTLARNVCEEDLVSRSDFTH